MVWCRSGTGDVDVSAWCRLRSNDVKLSRADAARETETGQGHSHVVDELNTRVRLDSDSASITTCLPGQIDRPPESECTDLLVVEKGEAEVVAQGKVVRVKAGEGTYNPKDQEPFPPICDMETIWMHGWTRNWVLEKETPSQRSRSSIRCAC